MSFFWVKARLSRTCILCFLSHILLLYSLSQEVGLFFSFLLIYRTQLTFVVVLAFSPKLQLTVLFNFPVLILQTLLTCPSSCLWYMRQSIRRFSVQTLGWFQLVLRNILPWTVLPKKLSVACHVTYFLIHEKKWTPRQIIMKFECTEIGLFCSLKKMYIHFNKKRLYLSAWATLTKYHRRRGPG